MKPNRYTLAAMFLFTCLTLLALTFPFCRYGSLAHQRHRASPGRYPQGTRFQTLGVPIPPDFSKEQELFTFQ